jgi:hypothetical protein
MQIRMTKSEKTRFAHRLLGYSAFGLLSLLVIGHSSLFLVGCVTKSKAKADAQAAFLAGQQQAMVRMQQQQLQQARGAVVSIVGPVSNPNIAWTEDLTVAKAILAAVYTGNGDPSHIFIIRNGQAIQLDPKQLMSGQDPPLQPGDVVQLMQ